MEERNLEKAGRRRGKSERRIYSPKAQRSPDPSIHSSLCCSCTIPISVLAHSYAAGSDWDARLRSPTALPSPRFVLVETEVTVYLTMVMQRKRPTRVRQNASDKRKESSSLQLGRNGFLIYYKPNSLYYLGRYKII